MARRKHSPEPDLATLYPWYEALAAPKVFNNLTKREAVRLRYVLYSIRATDKEIYEWKHLDTSRFPLKYLTIQMTEQGGVYEVRIVRDAMMLGVLSTNGAIIDLPTDVEAAWRECKIRTMDYTEEQVAMRNAASRIS